MTMPDERRRAVVEAGKFLLALASRQDFYGIMFPRTPPAVREMAKRLLRHYPTEAELDIFGIPDVQEAKDQK